MRQAVLWAGMNTNILTFSEGMTGPGIFNLDLKTSVGVILGFNAVMCIFPAYVATNGAKTGMRQMIQARYGMGYFGAMIIGLANVLTLLGYLSLTSILGGQCLSMASGSDMSWTVGIIVLAVIGLCMSFIGLRALHILAFTFVPVVVLLYIVLIGVTGNKLHFAVNETAKAAAKVTASGVLGFCASQVGFTASYSGIASDFTTHFPANTPRLPLFLAVYCGLFVPIVLIQIFGAACQAAAFSIPTWKAGAEVGAPNLLFAMSGGGGGAKFVMVLFCLSVVTNVATTIYSAGLSGQIVLPFLIRVPRYFLAIIVTAIYLPIAIVGSDHFFDILRNFLAVLGYWTALYLPPAIIEPLIFRSPVNSHTFPPEIWNKISKLPIGLAFFASTCVVSTVTGKRKPARTSSPPPAPPLGAWERLGRRRRSSPQHVLFQLTPRAFPSLPAPWLRPGGRAGSRARSPAAMREYLPPSHVSFFSVHRLTPSGDIAFEITCCAVALVFIPARWLERRFTHR